MSEKCLQCGKKDPSYQDGYCSYNCWLVNQPGEKPKGNIQKHEEIKQKAWELYKTQFSLSDGIADKLARMRICWLTAEKFLELAKQKQEEASDEM